MPGIREPLLDLAHEDANGVVPDDLGEKLLQSRDQELAQLLDALPAAVYTTDADGLITFFNQAAAELWGCRPEIGKDRWCGSWRLFFADGTPMEHEECPMAVALKENRAVRGGEAILARPDGSRVPFMPYPTPLRDAAGALVGAVNMLVDITHRKLAEERELAQMALRQAKERADQVRDELEQRVVERTHALGEINARLEREVTERRRVEAELREALDRLARHTESSPLGVIELAFDAGARQPGRVRAWSGQAEKIFGWRAEEVIGRDLVEIGMIQGRDVDKIATVRRELTVAGRRHATVSLQCLDRARTIRQCRFYASSARGGDDRPDAALLLVEDVTERLATLENVQRLAHHDTLTGLPNRLLFQDRLAQALRTARRQRHKVALMLLDLDHFKDVNDSLGHPAGDQMLRELADRLGGSIRATDTWARLGGDEFALVQTALASVEDAELVARRVMDGLDPPFTVEGQHVHMSASLGATVFPDDGDTPERLMRNADIALYRAKAAGRRSTAFYLPEMDRELRAQRSLQEGLRRALAADGRGFALVYQPIFDVRQRRMVAVEALARWSHPRGGEVPPATFIPVAENSGLIRPFGIWVLRAACRQARLWREAGLTLAVNVSVAQLRDPELIPALRAALAEAHLDPHWIELEVTESVFLDPSKDLVLETLHEIADLGVGLAIDDFGTGYSSLGYLRQFPFSKVKIDGSFVRGIGRDAGSDAIVAAVVGLGHALGKRVTAEWVEDEAQIAFLANLGCDLAQGYLLGPPQPAEAITRLLTAVGPWAGTA